MSLNLILATNTPGKTRNWLLDRGIFTLKDDGSGGQIISARNQDIRFTYNQIPNPVNSWNMYALKFVRSEDVADDDGDVTGEVDYLGNPILADRFDRSKWVKWLKNNGTRVDFDWDRPLTFDENGDPLTFETIPLVAYQVDFDGGQFYIMKEHEKIHQWQ